MPRPISSLSILVLTCGLALTGLFSAPVAPRGTVAMEIDGGHLTIQPLLDNAVRVRFTRDPKAPAPSLVLSENIPAPASTLHESKQEFALELPHMRATVGRAMSAR